MMIKPKRLHRKSFLTLLETLIAFSLLSLLLMFVFGFFKEMMEISRLTEKQEKESFQRRYIESRLAYIFERLVSESGKQSDFFFYTEPLGGISQSTSLIVTFDNGVRFNPAFSGDVLGRLYVDSKGLFRLSVWPLRIKNPHEYMQEEVFLDGVADVRYEFYAAPERLRDDQQIATEKDAAGENKTPLKGEWQDVWPVCYNEMPSILKVTIEMKELDNEKTSQLKDNETKKWVFQYVLPSQKNYVYYPPSKFS